MVMRVGGLASGMDIDALVEKLMSAEKAPLNKLLQNKTRYEWQRDAYRDVNKKLKTFDTYIADNLVLKTLNSKTATSSNSDLVSATATGKASGTLTIEGVSQLAEAGRITSGQINGDKSTKIGDLVGDATYVEIKAPLADGTLPKEATKITITPDMTVEEFVKKVNESNAGVSAIFENGRFSFTAKNTGKGDISFESFDRDGKPTDQSEMKLESSEGATITKGKNSIFQVNGIATERTSNSFTLNGYNVTLNKTFNGTATSINKYEAARNERDNALNDYKAKESNFNTKRDTYYGVGASEYPSYTNAHQSAYDALFGKPLKMTEQQTYSAIGSSVFKELTADEVTFLGNYDTTGKSATDIKNDIKTISGLSDASITKLTALDDSKLEKLAALKTDEIGKLQDYTNYSTFGTKLKDIDVSSLQGFSYDSSKKLDEIHKDIDATSFTKEMKDALKSFTKDQLTDLVAKAQSGDPNVVDSLNRSKTIAQEKVATDDLLANYNKFGDQLLTDLGTGVKKVDDLTTDQKTLWNGLSAQQQGEFKAYAEKNIQRANYIASSSEKNVAETRKNNADTAFATAKADAEAAGILEPGTENIKAGLSTAPTGSSVTLTSTTNVDDMMTKIKDFVNTYNGLVKDFTAQSKETKYRDYAPLTEEQKKDMKENEIKLWDEKAKSGLLRGDSIIRDGLSKMRALVYDTNPALADSKFSSLFSVGITSSKNYNEGGTLEIDEDKLRKALEEDPDAVERLFKNADGKKDGTVQKMDSNGKPEVDKDGKPVMVAADTRGFLDKLRDSMKTFEVAIEKKAGRSTMTDGQYSIGKTLQDTEKRIDSWQTKLKNIEARYWKQFSAMETAINKANSQSSMFAQGQ